MTNVLNATSTVSPRCNHTGMRANHLLDIPDHSVHLLEFGMPHFNMDEIVRDVIAAQDRAGALEPFTSRYSQFDIAAAYDVARRVHDFRVANGAQPIGRKIGFTNAEMWALFGVQEPMWGYIYEHTIIEAVHGSLKFDLGSFRQPRIEPEIIVHFRDAPSPRATATDLLSCVDWVAHGFEIVQSHFPDWKFQAADTIADAGLHGALILGERVSVSSLGDDALSRLASFSIDLACDGIKRETGTGRNVLGNPMSAVAHLLRVLETSGNFPLIGAGEVVTTGTLTKAYPIHAEERWETELHGINIPGLAVQFQRAKKD